MSSYRGRPSKGCDPCRAKKVKCDEGKPICIRCSKSGHECKYRDQADLLFRNQTAFAAQKAEESWRKRSRSHQRNNSESVLSLPQSSPPTRRLSSTPSTHSTHSSEMLPSPQTPECREPLTNIDELSVAFMPYDLRCLAYERFVYDFVITESPNTSCDDPSDALWDFIPYLYEKSGKGSCLATVRERSRDFHAL
ncbi:hypothetical protein DM02DRAFT_678808 [Periconia macrospinosa]|uniref:Zn(2)-C6 fungal-type domain-containing protein n=1 Tax=Periconia macrospinosa TaxID=97972 RepID=A0A2V1CWJ7_9PLEO|nr:hypothetical protein DM02DRAFT_678808 [Periconia macrospinosa]